MPFRNDQPVLQQSRTKAYQQRAFRKPDLRATTFNPVKAKIDGWELNFFGESQNLAHFRTRTMLLRFGHLPESRTFKALVAGSYRTSKRSPVIANHDFSWRTLNFLNRVAN
jgi:hypothetical protein